MNKTHFITLEVETSASLRLLLKALRSPAVANRLQDEISRELAQPQLLPLEICQVIGGTVNATKPGAESGVCVQSECANLGCGNAPTAKSIYCTHCNATPTSSNA